MALIKYVLPLEEIRGSLAGLVFSTGNTCTTVRAKLIKVGQASRLQVKNRANWNFLTHAWQTHLTDQDRKDWGAYSRGTTWLNRFNDTIHIGGLNCFLRLNATRLSYSLPPRFHSPTDFGPAADGEISFHAYHTTHRIVIPQPPPPWDIGFADEILYIAQSFPAHLGNAAIPNRLRSLAAIEGLGGGHSPFPVDVRSAWTLNPGQRVTLRVFFQDIQFRLSEKDYFTAATEPPP